LTLAAATENIARLAVFFQLRHVASTKRFPPFDLKRIHPVQPSA